MSSNVASTDLKQTDRHISLPERSLSQYPLSQATGPDPTPAFSILLLPAPLESVVATPSWTATGSSCLPPGPVAPSRESRTPWATTGAQEHTGAFGRGTSPGTPGPPWTTPATPKQCNPRLAPCGVDVSAPAFTQEATHCQGRSTGRRCSGIPSSPWSWTDFLTPSPRPETGCLPAFLTEASYPC